MSWRKLGTIIRLQVQTQPMKSVDDSGVKNYTPQHGLLSVESFQFDSDGITIEKDGDNIIDMHNANHPQSHHLGANPISFGFTSHYNRLQKQFGNHLQVGIAAENVIVETDEQFNDDDLDANLAIELANGSKIQVNQLYGIPPCEPFTRFCLQVNASDVDPTRMKESLQFLASGARGFAGVPITDQRHTLSVGDAIYIKSE